MLCCKLYTRFIDSCKHDQESRAVRRERLDVWPPKSKCDRKIGQGLDSFGIKVKPLSYLLSSFIHVEPTSAIRRVGQNRVLQNGVSKDPGERENLVKFLRGRGVSPVTYQRFKSSCGTNQKADFFTFIDF